MQEPNLKKRLSMFTTRIRVKNRLHVMKSLMLFGGTIMKENERQGKVAMDASFEGLDSIFRKSLLKRVEHWLCSQDQLQEMPTLASSEAQSSIPSDMLELNAQQIETKLIEMRNKNAKRLEDVVRKADDMKAQMAGVVQVQQTVILVILIVVICLFIKFLGIKDIVSRGVHWTN